MNKKIWLMFALSSLLAMACSDGEDGAECGNGTVEEGEECDDGNQVDDDACSNACKLNKKEEPKAECGNGKVEAGEECDDGNQVDDDECSNACKYNNAEPKAECGNGKVESGEECDDGNLNDGDGCSSKCKKETQSSGFKSVCGNGIVESGEMCDSDDAFCQDCEWKGSTWYWPNPGPETKCDDGLFEAGEICEVGYASSSYGQEEWVCEKVNGVCQWRTPGAACGNGIVEAGEVCDDGNLVPGDGCSKKCTKEDPKQCQMRNGSLADVLLVVDGDTLKLRVKNDGKCQYTTTVTVRLHGIDCPECLKENTTSELDKGYSANACVKAPACDPKSADYKDCMNHNEVGGYEAMELVKQLVYSKENNAEVRVACETVSDTDSTCLLDATRNRYLAYLSVMKDGKMVDIAHEVIRAGYGMPFSAFTSQRIAEYCAVEQEAIDDKAGFWANGNTAKDAIKASFGSEKQSWRLLSTHCK